MRHSRYYRTQLNQQEQTVYDILVEAMEKMAPEVTLSAFDTSKTQQILDALNMDNPHLFYVDFYKSQVWHSPLRTRVVLHYVFTREMVQSMQQRINQEVAPIIQACQGKKGKELASCIHDWLVLRGAYGTDTSHPQDAHTIVGMLLYKKCVCEGYAKAFQYIADAVGLLSLVVFGDAEHPDGTGGGHAWNIVRWKGKCYQIDTTFDGIIGKSFCSRAYFCLSTNQISRDHKFSSDFKLPDCPEYGGDLVLVDGTRKLMDFLAQEHQKGAAYSEVRLSRGFASGELMDKVKKKLTMKDWIWYGKIDKWWYGEQQKSVFVTWK